MKLPSNTTVTIRHNDNVYSAELAWDATGYDLLEAFTGLMFTAGFGIETIVDSLEEVKELHEE